MLDVRLFLQMIIAGLTGVVQRHFIHLWVRVCNWCILSMNEDHTSCINLVYATVPGGDVQNIFMYMYMYAVIQTSPTDFVS